MKYGRGYNGNSYSKAYQSWQNMFQRCYSEATQRRQPSYKGCEVHKDWWDFEVYEEWYLSNYVDGCVLDKDKLGSGKLYSAETCCFIKAQENAEMALSKKFKMRSPNGEIVEFNNMNKFCRDNGLLQSNMSMVNSGKQSHHKGWTKFK